MERREPPSGERRRRQRRPAGRAHACVLVHTCMHIASNHRAAVVATQVGGAQASPVSLSSLLSSLVASPAWTPPCTLSACLSPSLYLCWMNGWIPFLHSHRSNIDGWIDDPRWLIASHASYAKVFFFPGSTSLPLGSDVCCIIYACSLNLTCEFATQINADFRSNKLWNPYFKL